MLVLVRVGMMLYKCIYLYSWPYVYTPTPHTVKVLYPTVTTNNTYKTHKMETNYVFPGCFTYLHKYIALHQCCLCLDV